VVGSDESGSHARKDRLGAPSRPPAATGACRALAVAAVIFIVIAGAPAAARVPRPAPSTEPRWREHPLRVEHHGPLRAAACRTVSAKPASGRSRDPSSDAPGPALIAIVVAVVAALAFAARATALFLLRTFTEGAAGWFPTAPAIVPDRRRTPPIRDAYGPRIAAASLLPAVRGRVPRARAGTVHARALMARTRAVRGRVPSPQLPRLPRLAVPLSRARTLRLLTYAGPIALAAVLGGLVADLTTS
jgi:hypothetical protein